MERKKKQDTRGLCGCQKYDFLMFDTDKLKVGCIERSDGWYDDTQQKYVYTQLVLLVCWSVGPVHFTLDLGKGDAAAEGSRVAAIVDGLDGDVGERGQGER